MIAQRYKISDDLKKKIANGCGPASAFIDFVPDNILGRNICPACSEHDVDYHFGKTIEDKNIADRTFLNNMLRIIDHGYSWKWLRKLRKRIAYGYYLAVKKYGGPAFWDKTKPNLTVKQQKEYDKVYSL